MTIKSAKQISVRIGDEEIPPAKLMTDEGANPTEEDLKPFRRQPRNSNGQPLCLYCHKLCDIQHFTEEGIYCSVRCHTLDTRV